MLLLNMFPMICYSYYGSCQDAKRRGGGGWWGGGGGGGFAALRIPHESIVYVPFSSGRQKYWSKYCWCSLMWLMPLRSLSNCDYELNFYLRLILGPIHSNQVMGTDPVGSYHGTRNSRSNSVNPTYRYQSHD